jgi:histidinol-phosphatase (PHP family)
MEEYVQAAVERGITEICFTDHIPLPGGQDSDHRMEPHDMEFYLETIAALKSKYRGISILTGIEADYMEGLEEYLEDFLSRYSFDLVIMAIHFIEKWTGDQWVFDFDYTEETLPRQYRDYFEVMLKGVNTGLFDIVGHFDMIKRPGFPVLETVPGDVVKVLDAIQKQNMSIEINTSGFRRSINQSYPAPEILEPAVERGIPFVLSSDAHKPEHVGYRFDWILNRLFHLTDLKLARYRGRECSVRPLAQPGAG